MEYFVAMLPITAVERETGISKELLRMWERRYGFPQPERDSYGDRVYDQPQINKLRLIRRLLDAGFRPGKIVNLPDAELEQLITASQTGAEQTGPVLPELSDQLIMLLRNYRPPNFEHYISHHLLQFGLETFVSYVLPQASLCVENAVVLGLLEDYERELYYSHVQRILHQQLLTLQPAWHGPSLLITAMPDTIPRLELLQLEVLLRLDGVDIRCYGTQLSVMQIQDVMVRHAIDAVMVWFGPLLSSQRASDFIEELRFRLPQETAIWAFGKASGRQTRRHLPNLSWLSTSADLRLTVTQWQQQHARSQERVTSD